MKNSLHEYYKVGSLENYDEVYRAVAFFAFKYGRIDWLESNNEYWLEQDAKLRTDFNITTGFQVQDMPRMKYKSGDTALFQHNSLNAEFYRDFLAKEFHIHRYEWESCGYPQEFPPGKNSIHLPFYQTNTSQYCPLYALCTTGDRGMQQLAEHCPKFCEKYSLLYPEHLHMIGRYNSLFGVDKTLLESPEMWKKIKGIKPDRIVVNL